MKGSQGLAIAAGLAVIGAACNWLYISRKAQDLEKETFIYVKETAKIRPGDVFKEEHFGKVDIPKKYVGDLSKVGVRWSARNTVIGGIASRAYTENQLLLDQDLHTPTASSLAEQLGPNEISQEVMVDSTTFISENYNPGDKVLFFPPPASRIRVATKNPVPEGGVGPFRILRIGARAGSMRVLRSRGYRDTRGNVLVIPLTYLNLEKKELDDNSKKLRQLLDYAGGQGLGVSIQSARKADAKKR
jgi:hypothetical protein